MRSPLFVLCGALSVTAFVPAQTCVFLPADTPAVGVPDARPLGNGNPADPTYGTMRYQLQVPAALLGAQPLDIVEVCVAPAGSHTRTFTELQVRMGHSPNPLGTQMVFNMVGFTSRPVQYNDLRFDTSANEWLPLGMAFPFHYDATFGNLVLEFYVRQTGVLAGGSGDIGLRTDPSIPFVWNSGGSGYNGTIVPGGGIKLRLCTDDHGVIEYGVGGCVGSNGLRPTLQYGGSPQIGSTLQIGLEDAPALPGNLALLVHSFRPRIGPFDLTILGMNGCDARVFGDVIVTQVTAGSSHTVPLALPPGLPGGFPVWNQWFCLDLPANPFGLTCSNFGRFMIGN